MFLFESAAIYVETLMLNNLNVPAQIYHTLFLGFNSLEYNQVVASGVSITILVDCNNVISMVFGQHDDWP